MERGAHISGFPLIITDEPEVVMSAHNQTDDRQSPDSMELDVDIAMNMGFDSVVHYGYTYNHTFDNADSIETDEVFQGSKSKSNAELERKALMEILQQHRMVVSIPLRTDISVGMVIKLNIPHAETIDGNSGDSLNDDRYLITDLSVNFQPTEGSGVMHLECVKESLTMKIEDAQSAYDSDKGAKNV
jgi:hypothetical protein